MAPAGQRASQAVSAAHTGHRGARLEQPGQQESRGPSWNSPTHRRALPGGGKLQVGPLTSGKGTARWFMASLCPPPGKTIHSHAHVCTAGPATAVPLTKCAIWGFATSQEGQYVQQRPRVAGTGAQGGQWSPGSGVPFSVDPVRPQKASNDDASKRTKEPV